MNNKKAIVMYGGSFNPPLVSHFLLAQQIINGIQEVEKVIFVPVNSKYQKQELQSNEHRYNMLKMLTDKNEKFDLSDIELKSQRPLYTIETLQKLQEQYKDYNIYLTMGTDNLKELHTWKNPEKLTKDFKIIVFERDQDVLEKIIEESKFLKSTKDTFIKLPNAIRSNISSSYARKLIEQGKSIRYLTLDEIYNYINENNLYK